MWATSSRRPFARAVALVAVCALVCACDGGGHARNTPPTASFTVTPSSGQVPLTVTFNASASSDPDGTIVRYEWWFGDGVGFDGKDAERQHTYLFGGRFVVTLKVTDDRDGIGTSSALVIVTSDTAAKWYSVIEIPPGGQACVTPTSINNLGMVAGHYYRKDGTDQFMHAFLFDGRNSIDLGTLGGKWAFAWDLNDYGDVVGESPIAGGDSRAFLFTKGTMRDLGALDGRVSGATGINNAGQIVGWWVRDHNLAFLYENGQMRSLGSPGTDSYAGAISENGTVAGVWWTSFPYDLPRNLFIYRNGVMTDVGGAVIDEVRGINDAGDVVGMWHAGCGPYNGFLYRGGVLQPLVCGFSPATGINNEGVVVGYANFDRGAGAYVWDRTKGLQDLNTLIDPALGSRLFLAKSINDVGQIVAVENRDAGQCDRAFLLTPAR